MALRAGTLIPIVIALLASNLRADEPFRPQPGKFPSPTEAKSYRGELVFVDHVNRRGSPRLNVDGHYHEGRLHHFAMLPYGVIRYRGAPADLRDIPIGTVLYVATEVMVLVIRLMLCQRWFDGWPGVEGFSLKPRVFLRSAQSSPGHPFHQRKMDRALVCR